MHPEDSEDLGRWPAISQHSREWMEDAKMISVAGYHQVLEDGPDKCGSESDAECSDRGEKWADSEMCTPEMFGPDGNNRSGPQVLSTAQANALRAAAHSKVASASAPVPEPHTPTPVPSDDDEGEMTEDQKRAIRRFSKKTSGRAEA
jgi:hypothetical protein